MANFKRKGPKSTRAGCLMCKPHKHQAMKDTYEAQPMQERRALLAEAEGEFEGRSWPSTKGRKPYTIERCSGSGTYEPKEDHWMVYRGYATGAARDEALRVLQRKAAMVLAPWGRRRREFFRVGPTRE